MNLELLYCTEIVCYLGSHYKKVIVIALLVLFIIWLLHFPGRIPKWLINFALNKLAPAVSYQLPIVPFGLY